MLHHSFCVIGGHKSIFYYYSVSFRFYNILKFEFDKFTTIFHFRVRNIFQKKNLFEFGFQFRIQLTLAMENSIKTPVKFHLVS